MKVLFKYAAIAAAALTMGLTSCSNNNDLPDNGGTIIPGEPTAMSMVITSPNVEQGRSATRAQDLSGPTAAETKIDKVDVLIYGQTTAGFTLEKVEHLTINAHFDNVGAASDHKYQLKPGNKITTTTGQKRIYVSINTPSTVTLPGLSTTESEITSLKHTITSATELTSATNGFAMFSTGVESVNLVKETGGVTPPTNTVTATVARLVAKITLESAPAIESSPASGVIKTTDGGWIHDLSYELFNNSTETYLLQHKDAAVVKSPKWGATPLFLTNPTTYSSSVSTATGDIKYATENTVDGAAAIGDGSIETYISIRGKYVPKFYSKADGSADTNTSASDAPMNFWTVATTDGNFRYFKSLQDANDFMGLPGVTPAPGQPTAYTGGVCYYRGFFKVNDPNNPFGVVRNTYYKSTITEIKGLGAPTDAAVGTAQIATSLTMEVDVEPWTLSGENWVLQ